MYDVAKMFLNTLNHWNYDTPSKRRQTAAPDDAYKVNYNR